MTFRVAPDYQSYLRTPAVRHPNERARLIVAIGSVWIAFGFVLAIAFSSGMSGLLALILTILVVVAAAWLIERMRQAHLLGRAIKVTPNSFPEIHAEIAELRAED